MTIPLFWPEDSASSQSPWMTARGPRDHSPVTGLRSLGQQTGLEQSSQCLTMVRHVSFLVTHYTHKHISNAIFTLTMWSFSSLCYLICLKVNSQPINGSLPRAENLGRGTENEPAPTMQLQVRSSGLDQMRPMGSMDSFLNIY